MDETGWTEDEAKKHLQELKNRTGIKDSQYKKYCLWTFSIDEAEEQYQKILKRKAKNQKRLDDCVKKTMAATGWTEEEAKTQIKDAKKRIGMKYAEYTKYKLYLVPAEEQEEQYQKILKRKAKNQKRLEKCVEKTMAATGWTAEEAKMQIKDAKKRVGMKYAEYTKYKLYLVPAEEQKEAYQQALERATRRAERREKNIMAVVKGTGWSEKQAKQALDEARINREIKNVDYISFELWNYPAEEQVDKLKELREQEGEREIEKCVRTTMEKTGWNYEEANCHVRDAIKRTQCRTDEYLTYRFYELKPEVQNEICLVATSRRMTKKYNVNARFVNILYNKAATNRFFGDYVGRAWCINTQITKEEFIEKFKNSRKLFYKPMKSHWGNGAEPFDLNERSIEEIYEVLREYPIGVVEEYVFQHEKMNEMSPTAVNTVRFVTVSSSTQPVCEDGRKADIVYVMMKMGGATGCVDNLHGGGLGAGVDLKTGILCTNGVDDGAINVFEKHPVTGTAIKGFQIPYYEEAKQMVLEIIDKLNIQGYLGWDIAITDKGPVIIEVNTTPGVTLLQLPYLPEKKGMKHLYDKYLLDD